MTGEEHQFIAHTLIGCALGIGFGMLGVALWEFFYGDEH